MVEQGRGGRIINISSTGGKGFRGAPTERPLWTRPQLLEGKAAVPGTGAAGVSRSTR